MGKPTALAVSLTEYIGVRSDTRGTETSKFPEEKISTEIPLVVASERGAAQSPYQLLLQENGLESPAIVGVCFVFVVVLVVCVVVLVGFCVFLFVVVWFFFL